MTQSFSRGDERVSGFSESEISALYPYMRSRFDSGTEVWSLMGFGSGHVDSMWTGASQGFASQDTVHLDGEVAFDLGLVGAEQVLLERAGFGLFAFGDVGWSRLVVTRGAADRQNIVKRYPRAQIGPECSLRVRGSATPGFPLGSPAVP